MRPALFPMIPPKTKPIFRSHPKSGVVVLLAVVLAALLLTGMTGAPGSAADFRHKIGKIADRGDILRLVISPK